MQNVATKSNFIIEIYANTIAGHGPPRYIIIMKLTSKLNMKSITIPVDSE